MVFRSLELSVHLILEAKDSCFRAKTDLIIRNRHNPFKVSRYPRYRGIEGIGGIEGIEVSKVSYQGIEGILQSRLGIEGIVGIVRFS